MSKTARPVGKVQANTPASDTFFDVHVEKHDYLSSDDLVWTATEVPSPDGAQTLETYGVVTGNQSISEGARLPSDTDRVSDEDGAFPASTVRTAQVAVVRNNPDRLWLSPKPAQPVYRAVGIHRSRALYIDEMENTVPMGFLRDGLPVPLDLRYLDGTHGAHISVSGMSGVATKTTYALFLLRSLLLAAPRGAFYNGLRIIVFSVKGEDMLWLDTPNAELDRKPPEHKRMWDTMFGAGKWGPFQDVQFWAPPMPNLPQEPNTSHRMDKVNPFSWTPEEFVKDEMLRFLLSAQDASDLPQVASLTEYITTKLRRTSIANRDGAVVVGTRTIYDLKGLVNFLGDELEDTERESLWAPRNTHASTIGAFMRRLRAAASQLGSLIRTGGQGVNPYASKVTVIDIHRLSAISQRFVVGVVLSRIHRDKDANLYDGTLIVVLDELNRYAPRTGNSPLKEILVDIAQRGRSLQTILVGCQQAASRVAEDVIGNAAIQAVGRLDLAEAEKREYGLVDKNLRYRVTRLRPGTMVVKQPTIPTPLTVSFPFPCWATRKSEVPRTSAGDSIIAG